MALWLLLGSAELIAAPPPRPTILVLLQGQEQNKPNVTPLHIQNPFETSHNVSKNVNATQLDRFVALCQECSWLLEKNRNSHLAGTTGPDAAPSPRGLPSILLPCGVAGIKGRKKRNRTSASDRVKSLLQSLKKNSVPEKS